MDWMGIGVLIIGIAFAVLVLFLVKPIKKLSSVLESVQQSTDRLPAVMDDVTQQATNVLHTSNATLGNVNEQVKEISPLFQIVGDAGEASREFTTTALTKVTTFKQQTSGATSFTRHEKYDGIYGLVSFIYFMLQRKKEIKKSLPAQIK